MAQSSKRNAEQAFEGQSNEAKGNKRVRQKKSTDTPKKHKSAKAGPSQIGDTTETVANQSTKKVKTLATPSQSKETVSPASSSPTKSAKSPKVVDTKQTNNVQKQSKKHKKHRKQKHDASESRPASNTDGTVAKKEGKKKNKKAKPGPKDTQRQDRSDKNAWTLSKAIGGTFNDQDPIMTPDGQYLMLTTRREVQIYSTSTSLLVRSIASPDNGVLRTCTLSTSRQDDLFIGSEDGLISKFNWKTGKMVGQWQSELELAHLVFANASNKHEVLFAIAPLSGFGTCLVLVALERDNPEANYKVLLRKESFLEFVDFLPDLSVIIVASKEEIHLGTLAQDENVDHGLDAYDWKSIQMKARIVSCDVHISSIPAAPKLPTINVIVGLQTGVIMVYKNLLNSLAAIEKGRKQQKLGQRLHWHRTAVRTVKWSRDGNYLISGGDESVLVLWQLDTNQRQYLPHLSTSILNLTVSKSGAYYALRLGDNSVMILSTADLVPSTNVVGLSLAVRHAPMNNALLHPSEPNKLLLATSIKSAGPNARTEATHLQTYDIENNVQLGRQALTRNLVTTVNIGPNGQPLREPDVTQMQISYDARWLATVDEWAPNATDVEALYLKENAAQDLPYELTLRLWCWKPDDNSWEPTTRIDEPHTKGHASILSLVSNPTSLEFASLGSDGCVKFWTPKARLRDGVLVKDKTGTPLFNWSCSRVVQIGAEARVSRSECCGALAYSDDGSVLAVSYSGSSEQRQVHLLDAKAGTIVLSQPDIISSAPSRLGFCGRYLIAVSDTVVVFDTITYQTTFRLQLESKFVLNPADRGRFLAVNAQNNTFAVGLNGGPRNKEGLVAIFSIDKLEKAPAQTISIPGHLRALLVDPASRGFVIIDGDSAVRKIAPPTSQSSVHSAMVPYVKNGTLIPEAKRGLEGMFGLGEIETTLPNQNQLLLKDAERPAQSLDDLLSRPALTAQLGVQELFERVARAVSGVSAGVSAQD